MRHLRKEARFYRDLFMSKKTWIFVFVLFYIAISPSFALKDIRRSEGVRGVGAAGMRFPAISPDGKWVAFSMHGDIWKVPVNGGIAKRLTLHQSDDVKPRWSPDGKWIAFASKRRGNFDIWIVSAEGGAPKQITYHSSWDSLSGWSPNGKWIIFYSFRSGSLELWRIPRKGGLPIQLTFDGGRDATISHDGTKMVYCRGEANIWRKGYQGSGNWDIYSISLDKKEIPKRLTKYKGNDLYPAFSADGKVIYFIREGKVGKNQFAYNLWTMSFDGKDPKQITHYNSDISTPHLSKDGKFLVFERNFHIWYLNLSTLKSRLVPVIINADNKCDQESIRVISEGNEMGDWSPDSQKIVFALNGDIWMMPAHGGKAERITQGASKDQWPRFSPDGNSIAYYSDKSGNNDIYILDLKTRNEKRLTHHQSDDFFHSWSPDGSKIIFTSERSGNRDIWMISIQGGPARQITNSPQSEDDATFSPDGKWIAFDSGKSGNQEIWIMPIGGNYEKDAKQFSHQGGLTQVPSWSSDSRFIAYETNDEEGNTSIWMKPVQGGPAMQVATKCSTPNWSPDGKWIMFESDRSGKKSIYRIEAPTKIRTGKQIAFFAQVEVDLQKERKQIFEEAWKAIQLGFYDPSFHGKDWKSIGRKYKKLIDNTRTNLEFNVVINRMLGELGASHMGISGPSEKNKMQTGYMGWELQAIPASRGLRVKSILREGPADKVWVRTGDYIYQIGKSIVSYQTNISKILNGKVDKKVKVFVSPSPRIADGRYINITPVTAQKIANLKYRQWLREKIRLVRTKCRGKVLYLHLSEMDATNLKRFRQLVVKTVKIAKGMILDIRNNGGGLIHEPLLEILIRKPFLAYKSRGQNQPFLQPRLYWNKPVVVLINQRSFSDAEVFAHAFKVLKRGYVVGVPTAGGVIGTRDITLSNQATFRVPRVGYYTLENVNLEGLGVKPDYHVEETPEDRRTGRDPQLLKAIEVLLKEIYKKKEVKKIEKK